MKLVVLVIAVVLAFTSALASYTMLHLNDASRENTAALRTILCLAEKQVLTSKQRTPEEKRVAVAFYRKALSEINAPPCEQEFTP